MFLPRQQILAPIGLVTQPNQYGQYPSGALKSAVNLTLRNPGELVQAPATTDSVTPGASNDRVVKLMPLDEGHVYAFHVNGTTWSVYENTSSADVPSALSTSDLFSATGQLTPIRANDRMIVNSLQGCLVGDYMAPSSAGERALRRAGLPCPQVEAVLYGGDGPIAAEDMVGYTACIVRRFADGYELRSAPAIPHCYSQQFASRPRVLVRIAPEYGLIPGDCVEVYRTDGIASATSTSNPGSTFKLVAERQITSAEISAGTAEFLDGQQYIPGVYKTTPGRELYTNPGQEGENHANLQPPLAKCCATFKGFAFYGNITDPPVWEYSVPGGCGSQDFCADAGIAVADFKRDGIGYRRATGVITASSAVITGVSAADMVGIVPGQKWSGDPATFPGGTSTVVSVGATSITMADAALIPGTDVLLVDVVEISGVIRSMVSIASPAVECDGFTGTSTAPVSFGVTIGADASLFPVWPDMTSFTVRGTNGQNYSPPIPEIDETPLTFTQTRRPNLLKWSKEQQPEHCPSASETFVGFGDLVAMTSSRDCMMIWCTDGVYRLSGTPGAFGFGEWQIDTVNESVLIAAPQAAYSLNEKHYAYANVGFVEMDSAGTAPNLTDRVIGDLLPGTKYSETAGIIVVANETDEEVLLTVGSGSPPDADVVYIFNTKQRGWTTLAGNSAPLVNVTAMAMQRSPASGEPRLLFGCFRSGLAPQYAGWNDTDSFLEAAAQYQPIYGDDPLEVKHWIWCDYLWAENNNGKTFTQTWGGVDQPGGGITIQALGEGAYARAWVPRSLGTKQLALNHSLSPGFAHLNSGDIQGRFQGLSVALKQLTNQGRQR